MHAHDTSNYERADIVSRLGPIYQHPLRALSAQICGQVPEQLPGSADALPLLSVGGYLALRGQLDVGGLGRRDRAYKDLPGPMKELIDWDQQRHDVQIKYEQVVEQFEPGGCSIRAAGCPRSCPAAR